MKTIDTPQAAGLALDENNETLTAAIGKVSEAANPETRAAAQKAVDKLQDERADIQALIREKGWDLLEDLIKRA